MELKTWEEADRALERFALVDAEIDKAAAVLRLAIQELQAKFERQVRADLEKHELLDKELKKFAQAHKTEFKPSPAGDGRSYEHAGVVLGFRQTPGRVGIRNEDKVLEWLYAFRGGTFARMAIEADREALLGVLRPSPDADQRLIETLAAHGITFQQKDKFFLEVT